MREHDEVRKKKSARKGGKKRAYYFKEGTQRNDRIGGQVQSWRKEKPGRKVSLNIEECGREAQRMGLSSANERTQEGKGGVDLSRGSKVGGKRRSDVRR